MEERKLTEKESLALITEMIRNTKNRMQVGDGNILLIWGYVTVAVAIIVYAVLMLTAEPLWNWLWFLILAIGYPLLLKEKRRQKSVPAAKTYVDKVSAGIWNTVGALAFIGVLLCFVFMFWGYNCWIIMMIYAFIIVGYGCVCQGIVIQERSLVAGGMFSIIDGSVVTCCAICQIPLTVNWVLPLYIIAFVLMTIIPGHIINRKALKSCRKN